MVENACSTTEQSVIPEEIKGFRLQVIESGLNEPAGHAWQADPSQYSSVLHVVHDVEVASPPGLNEPAGHAWQADPCLLYTSPSPRDGLLSRMPSSA